jgi:predicted hotdog family 3-hydroxylacyl-ACP dehydratase
MNPATLDHAGIAARIPHSGRMCLLERLLSWSPTEIVCSATSHTAADHPLRVADGLLAPVAIEYASQAMALHGTLCAAPGSPPTPGYLAAVRGVRLRVPRLDTVPGALRISATRVAGDAGQALYAFALHDQTGALLVEGRATVILNALPFSKTAAKAAS